MLISGLKQTIASCKKHTKTFNPYLKIWTLSNNGDYLLSGYYVSRDEMLYIY